MFDTNRNITFQVSADVAACQSEKHKRCSRNNELINIHCWSAREGLVDEQRRLFASNLTCFMRIGWKKANCPLKAFHTFTVIWNSQEQS